MTDDSFPFHGAFPPEPNDPIDRMLFGLPHYPTEENLQPGSPPDPSRVDALTALIVAETKGRPCPAMRLRAVVAADPKSFSHAEFIEAMQRAGVALYQPANVYGKIGAL